jgi:hypothetical protein
MLPKNDKIIWFRRDTNETTQDNIDQHEDLNKLNKHVKHLNQIKVNLMMN